MIDRNQARLRRARKTRAKIAELKSVPLAKGHDEVFYPGEIEANNDIANRRDGLLLPADTLESLASIARDTGLKSLLPF